MEYLLTGISQILCMKILFCQCAELVLIYLCLMYCCITCVNCFGIQLTAVIIPHFFLELTGSNLSLWWYFWKYFCLNLFKNMTASGSQYNVRQMDHLENRLLLKPYAQIPKVSGFR
jgi:hypothetical protein